MAARAVNWGGGSFPPWSDTSVGLYYSTLVLPLLPLRKLSTFAPILPEMVYINKVGNQPLQTDV